jgi:hypothetical protein
MSTKFFWIIIGSVLVIQISFSFYYSGEIINQNNQLNISEAQLVLLQKQETELEKKLSESTSLSNIKLKTADKNLSPIKKEINLRN